MATTSGNMNTLKVTGKDGNVFVMTPVDTEARQAIDEAKNLQFDDDYFTAEVSQDQSTVSVGLNGVPIGVTSPLRFDQDTAQGIVIGIDTSSVTPPEMTGATASADGASGLVPAPLTGDQGKFLKGDGTWDSLPVFAGTSNGVVNAPASANRNHYSFLDGMGDWSMLEEVSESSINGMFLSVTIGDREYKVVQIGNQLWMAENLDWKMDGITIGSSGTDPAACYYSNDENTYGINGLRYGLLYNYRAVDLMNTNANFPDGFRIPTATDWDTLSVTVQTAVKFNSKTGWPSGREGTDDFGFGSLPSGRLGYYGFEGLNDHASYFMYGEDSGGIVHNFNVGSSGNLPYGTYEGNTYSFNYARSVRLVKDAT